MAREFLGVGWNFPIRFEKPEMAATDQRESRRLTLAEYDESIRQSIRIILDTARGERVMRPDFGCGLHERVFAVNDAATRGLATDDVREALLKWEPRIDVLDVSVRASGLSDEVLQISVDYRVRSTDNRFNLVYPFYLERSPA